MSKGYCYECSEPVPPGVGICSPCNRQMKMDEAREREHEAEKEYEEQYHSDQ